MDNCIFCKISEGQIPCKKAYEDERILAFHDITPQAPVHILIIPREHIESVSRLEKANMDIVAEMTETAKKLAKEYGVEQTGFRLVINTGSDGGQSVGHLHMHLLGGRSLAWPPG
jgi:histidine triad (HIT) family protein